VLCLAGLIRDFGTSVIERMIREQLTGEMHLDWRAEGLACEIVLQPDGAKYTAILRASSRVSNGLFARSEAEKDGE
jgi:hypothetical protein